MIHNFNIQHIIYNACTEECIPAAHMPNPMGFTILYNKLSFGIKLFLRIEELTSYEVIKSGIFFTISMTTVTDGHFVVHDNFLYHLNQMHVRCKMALISS